MDRKSRSKNHRMTRRKHRGGYYGASGAIAPGAMQWSRGSEMGNWAISSRGGNTQYGSGRKTKSRGGMLFCPDMSAPNPQTGKCADGSDPRSNDPSGSGGKRRRLTKRRQTKKTRKHRGGGSYGGVSASYQGSGSRGIADFKPIVTRDGSGTAAGGAFNNFGAQPGSGYSSFVKAA